MQHIRAIAAIPWAKVSGTLTAPDSEFRTMPSQDRELVGARVDFCIFNKNPSSSRILEASLQKRERLGEGPPRDINRPSRQ